MKRLLFILLVIILFSVFVANNNSNPKNIIMGLIKRGAIQPGDLRYKVYLLGVLPIGEAIFGIERMEEYNGKKIYHLHAVAQSLKVFSKFFSGAALLDSYVNTEELNPIIFKQKIIISGKKDIDREVIYDQKSGVMSIAGVKRQILPNTQDPLSAMLNIKRMDFNKVREWEMNINTNQKNYILKGIAAQQDIIVNKKTYRIVLAKAEIKRRDKNPYHKSNISMVLLNEKENIPILIKVFSSGILINAKLIDIR